MIEQVFAAWLAQPELSIRGLLPRALARVSAVSGRTQSHDARYKADVNQTACMLEINGTY
jgi:hypothetical protein